MRCCLSLAEIHLLWCGGCGGWGGCSLQGRELPGQGKLTGKAGGEWSVITIMIEDFSPLSVLFALLLTDFWSILWDYRFSKWCPPSLPAIVCVWVWLWWCRTQLTGFTSMSFYLQMHKSVALITFANEQMLISSIIKKMFASFSDSGCLRGRGEKNKTITSCMWWGTSTQKVMMDLWCNRSRFRMKLFYCVTWSTSVIKTQVTLAIPESTSG